MAAQTSRRGEFRTRRSPGAAGQSFVSQATIEWTIFLILAAYRIVAALLRRRAQAML